MREGLVPAELVRPATDAQIARSNYANFPWERYRGDGKLDGPPFPLLREREFGIVGLSDGTVTLERR